MLQLIRTLRESARARLACLIEIVAAEASAAAEGLGGVSAIVSTRGPAIAPAVVIPAVDLVRTPVDRALHDGAIAAVRIAVLRVVVVAIEIVRVVVVEAAFEASCAGHMPKMLCHVRAVLPAALARAPPRPAHVLRGKQ